MSNFFDSEIIQEELEEINDLQKEVYQKAFQRMNREDQKEHVELLIELLEKQKIMYTRLSLSDDPQAVKMREQLRKSVTIMGFPEGTDINVLFDGMKNTIQSLKNRID